MRREVQYFLYKSPIGILPVAYSEDGVFFLELKSKLESFIGYLQGRGLSPVKADKPPRLPSDLITLWHGTRMGTGFAPTAFPTAL